MFFVISRCSWFSRCWLNQRRACSLRRSEVLASHCQLGSPDPVPLELTNVSAVGVLLMEDVKSEYDIVFSFDALSVDCMFKLAFSVLELFAFKVPCAS